VNLSRRGRRQPHRPRPAGQFGVPAVRRRSLGVDYEFHPAEPPRGRCTMHLNRETGGGMSSFVVVANRLPVDEVITETGRTWRRSPGGLVTALHPVLTERHGAWIGWSGGITEEEDLAASGGMPDPMTVDGLELCSVPLTADDIERYYEGFSNG